MTIERDSNTGQYRAFSGPFVVFAGTKARARRKLETAMRIARDGGSECIAPRCRRYVPPDQGSAYCATCIKADQA